MALVKKKSCYRWICRGQRQAQQPSEELMKGSTRWKGEIEREGGVQVVWE